MGDGIPVLQLAVAGAGAAALYQFWWLPYQTRLELERLALAAARANVRNGMGAEEAIQQALAGACTVGATVYKVPPSVAGPLCSVAGVVAEKLGKALGKGAGKAAIAGGKATKVAGKAVGKGAVTAAKGVRKAASWLGLGGLPYDLADFEDPHGGRPPAERPARRTGRSQARRQSAAAAGAAFYLRHLDR